MIDIMERFIEDLHEAVGTKPLANQIAHLLIEADDFAAINGAILALALWHSDPDLTKENAVQLAKDLGDFVATEIDENWDQFVETRRRLAAGELQ